VSSEKPCSQHFRSFSYLLYKGRSQSRQDRAFAHIGILFRPTREATLAIASTKKMFMESRSNIAPLRLRRAGPTSGTAKNSLAGVPVEDIADAVHISSHNLQRRLQDEGPSFQRVLEETPRQLARHYLNNPVLELNEAAYLLGYEDENSFVRAFRT
jgi:AraC-like DNA-binding protein